MTTEKMPILVLWETNPEGIRFFVIPYHESSYEIIQKCHGKFLGLTNTREEDDNINNLSSLLENLSPIYDSRQPDTSLILDQKYIMVHSGVIL